MKVYLGSARLATDTDHQITPAQVQTAADRFGVNISPSELKGKGDSRILQTLMDKIVAKTNTPAEKLLPAFRQLFPYDGIQTQTETALWDPELLQSADPVIYDANGEVIPLSSRFRGENITSLKEKHSENILQERGYLSANPIAFSRNNDNIIIIDVGHSVGAAQKNYPVKLLESRNHAKLAEGQEITGKAFAGKGTKIEIRDKFRLEASYKKPADSFKKVSGNSYIFIKGKKRYVELHWYESNNEIYEMKVKRYLDEG